MAELRVSVNSSTLSLPVPGHPHKSDHSLNQLFCPDYEKLLTSDEQAMNLSCLPSTLVLVSLLVKWR